MDSLVKELANCHVIIATVPKSTHLINAAAIVKDMLQTGKKVGYIVLNRTYLFMKEQFEKVGIDTKEIMWVDAISKTIKDSVPYDKNCYYVNSPGNFDELKYVILKSLKSPFFQQEGVDYIVFDSLHHLFVYKDKEYIKKFFSGVAKKIKESNTKVVFLASDKKDYEDLMKKLGKYVDKVINLK